MSRYRIASEFEEEALYVASVPYMWRGSKKRERKISDLIRDEMPPGAAKFIKTHDDNIAIDQAEWIIREHGWSPCDTGSFRAALDEGEAALDAIWQRHFNFVPVSVYVHLTRYGSGGSFHPVGYHEIARRHGPAMSVRPDIRSDKPLYILAHETIHLAINAHVESIYGRQSENPKSYQVKEAIVDEVMLADEFQPIGGPFPRRPGFYEFLPRDWQDYPCFTAPLTYTLMT